MFTLNLDWTGKHFKTTETSLWFDETHYIELSYKYGVGRKLQAVGEFWANSTLTLHQ